MDHFAFLLRVVQKVRTGLLLWRPPPFVRPSVTYRQRLKSLSDFRDVQHRVLTDNLRGAGRRVLLGGGGGGFDKCAILISHIPTPTVRFALKSVQQTSTHC